MSALSFHFLVVLLVYFSCILTIGLFGLRKTHTEDDFLTASRTIGPWVEARFLASFFFVPIVFGLNWSRGKGTAAVSAMVSGCAGCLFRSLYSRMHATNIDAVEVGIGASAALYFLVCAVGRSAGGEGQTGGVQPGN
jgi:Na+/proline symporter